MRKQLHVRKGDTVVVIGGASKGKRGKVLKVVGNRVVIEKVAMIKRHMKKSQEHPQGAIVEREGSVHISNLMLKSVYDLGKRKKKAE